MNTLLSVVFAGLFILFIMIIHGKQYEKILALGSLYSKLFLRQTNAVNDLFYSFFNGNLVRWSFNFLVNDTLIFFF